MSEVFEGYERQYCELSANVSRKSNSFSASDSEQKHQWLSEIKVSLDEADVLIRVSLPRKASGGGRIVPMATPEKPVMVIGVDDSEYATYALEWTLDHFFSSTPNPPFKLVVVYAKPFPDVFVGVGGPGMIVGSAGSYQFLNEDLKKKAALVIATARGLCESRSVNDVKYEVDEGDARYVLCQAVDKHRASMLVVGSHGYGALKRAFLGSVSDYCAHQASCTVLIVKKLKTKEAAATPRWQRCQSIAGTCKRLFRFYDLTIAEKASHVDNNLTRKKKRKKTKGKSGLLLLISQLKPLHRGIAPMAATETPVMVIGIDDSEYAIAALEWTLDHFFSSTTNPPPFNFNLILLHAKPIPEVFVDVAGPGMVLGSAPGLYQVLDQHLKKKAGRIMEKAKQICAAKSVCDVEFVVEEGDARYVLCDAVNKHRASMLVVGSHGYGAIKRALLGSVSDYCAHHAPCTVTIVKPKPNT